MINPDIENVYLVRELNLNTIEVNENLEYAGSSNQNYRTKAIIILIVISISIIIILRNQKVYKDEKEQ